MYAYRLTSPIFEDEQRACARDEKKTRLVIIENKNHVPHHHATRYTYRANNIFFCFFFCDQYTEIL